jgi:hypothetical protein
MQSGPTSDLMSQSKPHILLISYYFPPMNAIGGVRPFRFYKYLKRFGYRCDVVTAVQQPPGGATDIHFVPDTTAPIWSGEARGSFFSTDFAMERVVRRFFLPGHVGIAWSKAAAAECRRLQRQNGHLKTVLVSSYPPTGAHLAALRVALGSRTPWIADFRDPMAIDPGVESGSTMLRWALSRMEAAAFRRAAAVIANVEAAASVWRERYTFAQDKLHVIWNGFDPAQQPQARPLQQNGGRVVIHAGSLYGGRNANAIIHSLIRLRRQHTNGSVAAARIKLIGPIGAGADVDVDVYNRASQEGWLELIREHVPQQEAQRMTEEAGGLLLLQPQSTVQVPGKLFDYICIGRPILALVPRESAVEWILTRAGIPYVCIYPDDPPEDADRKLLEYLSLPSTPTAPCEWFQEHFNAERQTRQLCSIIEDVVA